MHEEERRKFRNISDLAFSGGGGGGEVK